MKYLIKSRLRLRSLKASSVQDRHSTSSRESQPFWSQYLQASSRWNLFSGRTSIDFDWFNFCSPDKSFRNPITCPTNSELKLAVENECWLYGGYTNKTDLNGSCRIEGEKAHTNHQWLVLLMFVQALLFYTPWLLLGVFERILEFNKYFGKQQNYLI